MAYRTRRPVAWCSPPPARGIRVARPAPRPRLPANWGGPSGAVNHGRRRSVRPKFLDLRGSARLRPGAMARQAVRLLSTKGLTSEFVDQRSQRWAFPCRFPWTEYGVSNVCCALPTHRSSSTMTPVSAGHGGRQKDRPNFGVCPGQRHRHLAMIKKLRVNSRVPALNLRCFMQVPREGSSGLDGEKLAESGAISSSCWRYRRHKLGRRGIGGAGVSSPATAA
jgi:hypothetical protein